ncbi:hypothetical protein NM208_g4879 [Fusarium decemcellulare]|uniref:Uncharacterized protein n=1 Tax=Fusarium decemcellulare TaxID=57161 RepID=A0ACC1SJE1_9HYPO|nr:hypothetical protein NM208_g4879 [Fusarium decemcellulare]
MFVYQGKLNWLDYADNETFTIIFPKGVVRVDDPVYLFSQWTQDSEGAKKGNWFQTIIVQDLKKHPKSNDVTFTLPGAWYKFVITTEQNYAKIKVDMSNRTGAKESTVLNREWQAQGEPAKGASLRIWTGNITWRDNAVNEQAIFMLPEGYGDGRPVVSSWQWTKDGSGNYKTPSFKGASMKALQSDSGFAKFSFNAYYDITCTWELNTEKLAVKLKGDGQEAEVGKLDLAAKIEAHTHDFDPVEVVLPSKKELEVRLPQPQSSLLRTLEPLPFPRTLHEVLTQTYAFVDQAGYLAIQAQNRFTALDTDYHNQLGLVDSLKKDKENLENQAKSLTGSLNGANAKTAELKDQLAKALAEATRKQKDLEETIKGLRNHDIKDEALIKKLECDLNEANTKIAALQKGLDALKVEKQELLAKIKTKQTEISQLEIKRTELDNALKVQKDLNNKLEKDVLNLTKERDALLKANNGLQRDLGITKGQLDDTTKTLQATAEGLTKTQLKLDATEAELKALEKTLKYNKEMLENRDLDLDAARRKFSDKSDHMVRIANEYEDRLSRSGLPYKDLAAELREIL